jgi:hypothetical protein
VRRFAKEEPQSSHQGEIKPGTRRVVYDRDPIELYLAAVPFRPFVRRDLYRKLRYVLFALW